jgi:hypothetical protein
MSVTVTIVDDNNITLAVTNENVAVSVSDIALPLELYQPLITISATEPLNPQLNDLWLDIS